MEERREGEKPEVAPTASRPEEESRRSEEEHDRAADRDFAAWMSGVLWVVALALFYVLSIGPAIWFNKHVGFPNEQTLDVFYSPVVWLVEESFWFRNVIVWYVEFWE
jgi:hypothetical protein